MRATIGKYRKMAINIMLATIISLVLNFSYLVFVMVGVQKEPAPEEPRRPYAEQIVAAEESHTSVWEEAQSDEVLQRDVIIREESISRQNHKHDHSNPLSAKRGELFMLIDILFYGAVAMLFLVVMTDTSRRRHNTFTTRLFICLFLLIAAYMLAPQMTWRGEIVITAELLHRIINPMTILKLVATFIVTVFYGKIYELFYDKQMVEMENQQLKNENLSWQYNTLVNQVNPHFLFNSLNSLSMLVREAKNEDAVTYIDQMSDTYRYIMEEGRREKTTVEKELRFVDAYVYLLEIRYAGKLHIHIDVGQEFYAYQIPPLSIQPLIENAVKHNTITSTKPLHITITCEAEHIVVSNPIHPKLQSEESTGIGLENLASRYELIVGRRTEVIDDGERFTVKLPLIKPTK